MSVYINWLDSYSDKVEVGSPSLPTLTIYAELAQRESWCIVSTVFRVQVLGSAPFYGRLAQLVRAYLLHG